MTMSDCRLQITDQLKIAGLLIAVSACSTPPAPPPATPAKPSVKVVELSAIEARDRMATGELTSEALTRAYLRRITDVDDGGPMLGAVIEVNPAAEDEARARDEERKAGRVRGPLHGIPILIKDNVDVAGMVNSAGSLALAEHRPKADAFMVTRLRDAGAVILGKTNLSEWANFRSSRSTSGWSARGGQCKNPYALDRTPSGSSSGSAVAAAAGSCAAAVGTETNGSIISPASICGVVGLKPTVGLVSRAGIIPIAHSQDTAGPMARTVADAAVLLAAMAGGDPTDDATAEAGARKSDYVRALDAEGLRGARLGVLRPQNFGPKTDAVYEQALAVLRERGAELVDPVAIPAAGQLMGQGDLLQYEFKVDIERYLAEWAPTATVRNLDDLIAFNRREAAREMPYFGQETFEAAARKGPLTSPEYVELRERLQRLTRAEGIDAVMNQHRLDALVAPSTTPARPIDLVGGDAGGAGSSGPAAIAGYPHLTVPMGLVHGLPVGLSFYGRAWSEAVLLRLAFAYEQTSRARRPPTFAAGPAL